jgi:hypothetical protein
VAHTPALEPDEEGNPPSFLLFICCSFQQLQEKQDRMEVKRKKLAVAAALLEGKNADGCVRSWKVPLHVLILH